MISRRALVTSAAVLLAGAAVEGCAGRGLGKIFKGKSTRGYQGKGTRIPVLANNQALDPAPALKGVDFAIPAPQAQPSWPVPGWPHRPVAASVPPPPSCSRVTPLRSATRRCGRCTRRGIPQAA